MNVEQVWGVVRTILASTAGAWAIQKGYVDGNTLNTILGAVGVLAVAAWSIIAKKPQPPAAS